MRAHGKLIAMERMDSNKVYRQSKAERKFTDMTCPFVVRKYNQCLGGIDQEMECSRTWFRTKKWTVKVHPVLPKFGCCEQLDALCVRMYVR